MIIDSVCTLVNYHAIVSSYNPIACNCHDDDCCDYIDNDDDDGDDGGVISDDDDAA